MSYEAMAWTYALMAERPELTPADRHVWSTIAFHANPVTGEAYPGLPMLMAETGLSRTAIYSATAKLAQIVLREKRGQRRVWHFPGEKSAVRIL